MQTSLKSNSYNNLLNIISKMSVAVIEFCCRQIFIPKRVGIEYVNLNKFWKKKPT